MPRKYVSKFVIWQKILNAKIKPKYLWYSRKPNGTGNTYVRKLHGELI